LRPFLWHDLFTVFRYRKQYLSLDSALELTRGNPFSPLGILSHLNPVRESFTGVSSTTDESGTLIGQVCHALGAKYARLSFLMPSDECNSPAIYPLIEGLCCEAGDWGAFQLLAEVEECEAAFASLRRAGFNVYGWQRIWKLPVDNLGNDAPPCRAWQQTSEEGAIAVRGLYHSLVPPLAQRAEPFHLEQPRGLVYYQEGEVTGYVEGRVGPIGIYLQPLLHPAAENEAELIRDIPNHFQPRLGRPVYLVVRSYQAWLEKALQDMGAQVAPRQALLVKYLAVAKHFSLATKRLVHVLDTPQTETTATVINHIIYDN
jgi:hypothetical protein